MSDGWLSFEPAERRFPTVQRIMETEDIPADLAEKILAREKASKCFRNNLYQVVVTQLPQLQNGPAVIWLSIKRNDRHPIHDWRDLQRIKNELVGPENEGIELYPSESRVIDEANQYHLYVFKDPGFSLGLGWNVGRRVSDWDRAKKVGAKQRPLPEWMKKE